MEIRLGPDREVPWHTRLFVKRGTPNIVPAVCRAVRVDTYVFNVVPAGAEMDAKRAAALPCNLRMNDERLVDRYEFLSGNVLGPVLCSYRWNISFTCVLTKL